MELFFNKICNHLCTNQNAKNVKIREEKLLQFSNVSTTGNPFLVVRIGLFQIYLFRNFISDSEKKVRFIIYWFYFCTFSQSFAVVTLVTKKFSFAISEKLEKLRTQEKVGKLLEVPFQPTKELLDNISLKIVFFSNVF